jgi:hypothetical protein
MTASLTTMGPKWHPVTAKAFCKSAVSGMIWPSNNNSRWSSSRVIRGWAMSLFRRTMGLCGRSPGHIPGMRASLPHVDTINMSKSGNATLTTTGSIRCSKLIWVLL